MRINYLKKIGAIAIALLFSLNCFGYRTIKAETVASGGQFIGESDYVKLTLDTENVSSTIPQFTGDYSKMKSTDGILMEKGIPYTAKYPLDYFNKDLVVEVSVTLMDDTNIDASDSKYARVYLNKSNLVTVGWLGTNDSKVEWEVSVKNSADGSSYLKYLLMGFLDPDESDYSFDTTSRTIYYSPEESQAANYYNLIVGNEGGLFLSGDVIDFPDDQFFVQMKNENSFVFKTTTKNTGAIAIPYFYSKQYKIDYKMNDSEDAPAVPADTNPSKYASSPYDIESFDDPTRTGYEFIGWKEKIGEVLVDNDYIPADSSGDKVFVAQWRAKDYKIKFNPNNDSFPGQATGTMDDQNVNVGDNELIKNKYTAVGYIWKGWSLEEGVKPKEFDDKANYKVTVEDIVDKSEGYYLDTLYAQWEPIKYLVKYDKNAEDATGEMDDQKPLEYDTKYNLNPNEFERFGYDWVGWNTVADKSGDSYSNEQEFENLTAEDNGIVTMYAQWEPWKHYIEYDGNGADNMNAMPLQTFSFTDEHMTSLSNAFVREGYWFEGFRVEVNGSVRIVWTPQDFRDILVKLGRGSKIVLKAQWDKKPVKFIAPVTGVE